MAVNPDREQKVRAVLNDSEAIDIHHWQCSVQGCPQNYSPDLGYFTVARNDDHWIGTGSASLRIRRSATQVICGEHKDFMFLESFDVNTNLEHFRCPQKGGQRVMNILASGPPAYWLGEGYFRTR
jgi:hypothetical protein